MLLALEALGEAPRRPAILGLFAGAASYPVPGAAVNVALAGMAWRGDLFGPLPPPRLLVLGALRQQLRPLFDLGDDELQQVAARLLSRIHLLLHGIFKPDDNAQGVAVRLHRERHPAADNASHAIVIYPVHPPR